LRGAHFGIVSVRLKRLAPTYRRAELCHVVMPPREISMKEDEETKARQFMTVFENFHSESLRLPA
jgi:hypothetical protein